MRLRLIIEKSLRYLGCVVYGSLDSKRLEYYRGDVIVEDIALKLACAYIVAAKANENIG